MRFAPLLAALTLGAVCACAQMATPSDQARRLLPSQSLRDKAWGAWYAGASHDPALREPLLVQLKTAQALRNSGRDTEGFVYIQALFDALQVHGRYPVTCVLHGDPHTGNLYLDGEDRRGEDDGDEHHRRVLK